VEAACPLTVTLSSRLYHLKESGLLGFTASGALYFQLHIDPAVPSVAIPKRARVDLVHALHNLLKLGICIAVASRFYPLDAYLEELALR
jgi:hypothetical protein